MPKVSIVIPTYNRPQLLKRAIQSIVALPYKDHEIIVVQNGGRQDAVPVVEDFRKQGVDIQCYLREKADPNYARNEGISLARGKYIAFMDDDDEWLSGKLTRQVEMLDRNPDLGWVVSDARVMNQVGALVTVTDGRDYEKSYLELVRSGNFIWSLSFVMVRKSVLDEIGGLDERYRVASDYDLYLRLAQKYAFEFLEEPLVIYHVHEENLSGSNKKTWIERADIVKRIKASDRELREAIEQNLADAAERLYRMGLAQMASRQYRKAHICFSKALEYDSRVGLKYRWGKFKGPVYSFIRPYILMTLCWIRALSSPPLSFI